VVIVSFIKVVCFLIIEIELPFERAISGALTALEHINNLIKHSIKIHPPSSQSSREGTSLDNGASYQNLVEVSTGRCGNSQYKNS